MLNHFRTLLLNLDGDSASDANFPGEEIIPPGFRSIALPTYLQSLRRELFGARPDRAMLNYRLYQFLSVLHDTELEEYILDLDSRTTYGVREDLFDNSLFVPSSIKTGSQDSALFIFGPDATPDDSGVMREDWQVVLTSTTTADISHRSYPKVSDSISFTVTDGLSSLINVPGSGYSVKIKNGVAGDRWSIEAFSRPSRSLGTIVAGLRSVGETTLLQLFGSSPEEPFLTFRNLWAKHPETAYQLGGLLLAVGYRTEELRSSNNG